MTRPKDDHKTDTVGGAEMSSARQSQGLPASRREKSNVRQSTSSQSDVDAFVKKLKTLQPTATGGRGRLVFAMDATMSRQPTWDMALNEQARMFEVVRDVGSLDVQLIYFRGAGQCRASKWVSDPGALKQLMTSVACQGGFTQIRKVLRHALQETKTQKVNAVVYVGDAMEESIDEVCGHAGELGLLGVPVFLFQEGHDPAAERAFREIARLTKGSWCRFTPGASQELRALLEAVAVYAAGGRQALTALGQRQRHQGARKLLADLSRAD